MYALARPASWTLLCMAWVKWNIHPGEVTNKEQILTDRPIITFKSKKWSTCIMHRQLEIQF